MHQSPSQLSTKKDKTGATTKIFHLGCRGEWEGWEWMYELKERQVIASAVLQASAVNQQKETSLLVSRLQSNFQRIAQFLLD